VRPAPSALPPALAVPRLGSRRAAGLFLAGLLPRLALALVFLRYPIALDDMFQYDMLARSLAQGHGYRWYARADAEQLRPYLESFFGLDLDTLHIPEQGVVSTFRAPGYPAFLAGLYSVSGLAHRWEVARLVQAGLGAALAPLTAWLALRLGLKPRLASAAGLTTALYPILWLYPLGLASENTYIPLLVLTTIATLWAAEHKRTLAAVVPGILFAATTLTRGAFGAFLPLGVIWLARRSGWRPAATFALVGVAGLLPWMVRNSAVLGRTAYVDNSAGFNLYMGYHPEGDGGFVARVGVEALQILDDGERDQWARARALDFIRADPGRVPGLLLRRLAYFLGWEDQELIFFYSNGFFGPIPQPWLLLAYLTLITPWMLVAMGATIGLAMLPPSGTAAAAGRWLTAAIVAATLGAYILILTESRFHVPLVPLLAPYAAWACLERGAWGRFRLALTQRSVTALLAAAVLTILLAAWAWELARDAPELAALLSPGGHALRLDY
jgi:hypothetical protein